VKKGGLKDMKIIDSWKIIMTTTEGEEIDLGTDLPESITEPIDELIEQEYKVSWKEE
jgi:hypothetical protein